MPSNDIHEPLQHVDLNGLFFNENNLNCSEEKQADVIWIDKSIKGENAVAEGLEQAGSDDALVQNRSSK